MDKGEPSLELISSKLKTLAFEEDEQTSSDMSPGLQLKLETAECIFNWVKDVEEPKFLKIIEGNETGSTTGLSACLQVAATDFEKVFYETYEKIYYLILFGEVSEAKDLLVNLKLKVLKTDKEQLRETTKGYLYLLKTLQTYYLLRERETDSRLNSLLNVIPYFDELSEESKITVFRVKFMTFLNFRLHRKDPSVLQMLIKLEPKNAMWHYFMYKYHRCSRKEATWPPLMPGKETVSISTAMELEPENDLYLITGFQNLSEILKNKSPSSINEGKPLVWRDQNFTAIHEIMIYMKDHTKRMLEMTNFEPGPGYKYCLLAGVFSSYLPNYVKDLNLAEECITMAAECAPECSAINHRRGLITWQKTRDIIESAFYLWQAHDFGPKNFGALADLIHLLMADPIEHKEHIVTCILNALDESNVWGDKEKATFIFSQGCFLLMIGVSGVDVFNTWIDAYTLSSERNLFLDEMGHSRRFLWKKDLFSLDLCRNVIYELERGSLSDKDPNIVSKISEDLSKAFEDAEKAAKRFNSRPRLGKDGEETEKGQDKRNSDRKFNGNRNRDRRTPKDGEEFEDSEKQTRSYGDTSRPRPGPQDRNWRSNNSSSNAKRGSYDQKKE